MPSNPTLLWEQLNGKYYRNFEGYSMLWDVNIDDYVVTSAPFGGAIAICRDFSKLTTYKGPESRQTNILLYSGSGTFIRKIPWDNGRIRGIGWSELEHLVVVSENGNARVYYDFEGNFYQFSMGKVAEKVGIKECKFVNTGFVALLNNSRFVSVSRYDEPNPKLLCELSTEDKRVNCWTVIPPNKELEQQNLELLFCAESSLYTLDSASCKVHPISQKVMGGTARVVSISPSGDSIAILHENGKLVISRTSSFRDTPTVYDASQDSTPRQLVWCGNDTVALSWVDELTLVDRYGKSLGLFFDGPVVTFPEINGIRTLTNEKHDFFTKVPRVAVDIFRIGSTSPAAILRDCVDQLERKSPKADENLLIIGDRLAEAVDDCIEAAGYEFEAHWQKKLLKAASFGKSALDMYNSDRFVQMCDYLRVLNAVRQFDVGILLDYEQLLQLTPNRLIDRLLVRRMHLLAFKCAEYLQLPTEKIYVHWACTKIRVSPQPDEILCTEIVTRLNSLPGISYEEISRTAYEEGRSKLAITLTEYEPRPEKQVPLLLNMQEQELALTAAVKSYDTNLVVYVLNTLRQELPLAAFFRLINNKPMAAKCFEKLCTSQSLLESFYYQDDRRAATAELQYKHALNTYDLSERMSQLDKAQQKYSEIKANSFEAKALEEQHRLLAIQENLERDYEHPFVGLSVTDTISSLLKISQNPRALKLKDEFKVPDKRYWWIRLQALVARREWDALHKFSQSKKSPIGYEPFYNECLRAGSKREAAKYIQYCTNLTHKQRIEMYVKVDDIRQAAQEAAKAKDTDALHELRSMATPTVQTEIDNLM